jgi:hypothetical protein
MTNLFTHIVRFFAVILIQVFVLNQIEIGWGILPMIYPIMIFLIPIESGVVGLFAISLGMGVVLDIMSNTFGLHTSSLLLFAYLRPSILKRFAPREDYEANKEANYFTMGRNWFIFTFGSLLLLHHLWFFFFEVADIGSFFYILQKAVLSVPLSFLLCVGLQIIFVKKPKER